MTGEILPWEIMAIKPGIPVFLCTGYSSMIDEELAKEIGICRYLEKPLILTDLAQAIRSELARK